LETETIQTAEHEVQVSKMNSLLKRSKAEEKYRGNQSIWTKIYFPIFCNQQNKPPEFYSNIKILCLHF